MSHTHRLLTIAIATGACLLIHHQLQFPSLSLDRSPLPTRADPSTSDLEIPTPTPMRQWQHRWNVSELALSPSSNDTEYQLQDCLRERWIYIMGDSTGRFFMQALLLVLHRQFPDGFGRYLLFDGRKSHVNCTMEDFATPTVCKQHLTTGCGCIREFFDPQKRNQTHFRMGHICWRLGRILLSRLIGRPGQCARSLYNLRRSLGYSQ